MDTRKNEQIHVALLETSPNCIREKKKLDGDDEAETDIAEFSESTLIIQTKTVQRAKEKQTTSRAPLEIKRESFAT